VQALDQSLELPEKASTPVANGLPLRAAREAKLRSQINQVKKF